MGYDLGSIFGAMGGVKLPDPVETYQRTLSLGHLARQGEADALMLDNKRHDIAASRAYEAELPKVMAGGFSAQAVAEAVGRNPSAASMLLAESDKRRKALAELQHSGAQTAELQSKVRAADIKMIGGLAQHVATTGGDVGTLVGIIKRVGMDPASFGDPNDPAYPARVASLSIEADKQQTIAETKRAHGETERQTVARDTATTADRQATLAQTKVRDSASAANSAGMLGVARQREGREAATAADGKWSNDFANNRQVNLSTGQTRPMLDASGAPSQKVEKPLTETQGNATSYGIRMKDASATIKELEDSGAVDPSGFNVAMAGGTGIVGTPLNAAAGGMNPQAQVYKQAQKNWVTANLRKESGAAIPPKEMDADIAKWFPVPGDKPEVIASKAASREVAERAMSIQAGPGAGKIASDPGSKKAGKPAVINNDAEFEALASGAEFVGPDGKTRRKP